VLCWLQVMEELDLTDISEALYAGKKRATLTNMACHEMSGVCRTKPPPLPKVSSMGRMGWCMHACK
jgi:hypothetical protein